MILQINDYLNFELNFDCLLAVAVVFIDQSKNLQKSKQHLRYNAYLGSLRKLLDYVIHSTSLIIVL